MTRHWVFPTCIDYLDLGDRIFAINHIEYYVVGIFFMGLMGAVYNYRNFLVSMLALELMYLGTIAISLWIACVTCSLSGRILALCVLAIAASESAVGLGILVVLFRFTRNITFKAFQELKG